MDDTDKIILLQEHLEWLIEEIEHAGIDNNKLLSAVMFSKEALKKVEEN